jgi:alpha/beta superfamily hydrolase
MSPGLAQKPFLIDGPVGQLEALLELPKSGEPTGMAVICHPHPVHGGTMLNKVVHTLSRAFALQQFASLRFNFRGVGKSEGTFDEGKGEIQDALAALEWLKANISAGPMWLAGFSFGGAMAIHTAVTSSASGLVSVAPATSRFANDLDRQPECPWLIVQGDQDELVDINETIDYVNSLNPGPQLAIFPQGEHFFHGRLIELRDTVEDFIRSHAQPLD